MTPERWQQIKEVLDVTTVDPGRPRQALLEEACGGDGGLRREVESFLEHEHRLEGFIERPAVPILPEDRTAPEPREPPERPRPPAPALHVGPYRTVRLLGRGGMGAVYLAVREHEFEQQVALKLIRGILSEELIRRFHNERQILARLEHPHIARLLDGGTSDNGAPYFAMEYVDGVPLDRYCDEHRLDVRQRLELVLKVCSALEFAHRNLVVHRDLKPGNILVDASGTPKLLDFGIAKLLRPELAPEPVATLPGRQPLTLRYASPEQFRQQPVSTASDIYSLGLVLYKLLTGRLPCRLEAHRLPELMKVACEEDPLRPSEAVGRTERLPIPGAATLELTPESVSRTREGDPGALRRRLAGDVDSIVLKALRKEPQRRYASIEQLAEDIRRHLRGLPVTAREGTVTYRAGKFVRRNRWGLAFAAAVLLLVAGFTLALVRQLDQTSRARDRAERVSSFLVDLFESADPDQSAGKELTARELLDRGRRDLAAGLEEEPEVRTTLLNTLGQVYIKLGHYAEARELLKDSIGVLRRQHRGDHPALATAVNDLATVHYWMGNLPQAEALFRESIGMRQRLGNDEDLIKPMNNLASILMSRGELTEAEELYRRGLEMRRSLHGHDHPHVATSLRSLAMVLYTRGDLDGAEPLLREALDIWRRDPGPRSTRAALALSSLGRLEQERGRQDIAEEMLSEALDIRRQQLGEDHPHTALTKKDLADLLLSRGDWATARVLLTQALEILYRTKPEGDRDTADAESVLGAYLTARGRYEEAELCLLSGYRILRESRGPQAVHTREARQRLAELYEAWGKPGKAAEYRE